MRWQFKCSICSHLYFINDEDFTVDTPVGVKCTCGTYLSLTKIEPVPGRTSVVFPETKGAFSKPEDRDNEHVNDPKP